MAFRSGSPFDDFEREFEEMSRMMDQMLSGLRERDWSSAPAGQPIYYGVSVEVGPDGIPRVQQFGNVRPGREGLVEGGAREPFVTTFLDAEKNQVKVTAEMPGVDKQALKLEGTEEALHLQAQGEDRTYEKTVRFAVPVDPESAKAHYHNGVLEVTLNLKEPLRPKGREIKVE